MSLVGKAAGQTLVGSINKCDVLTISAYGIAVKHGYQGTEEEWLLSLKGGVYVDNTLSIDGVAADSKTAGDRIRANANGIAEAKQSAASALNTANSVNANLSNLQSSMNLHIADKNNPHKVTAAQLGLGKVNNTSDTEKPVSTKQSEAISKSLSSAKTYTDEQIRIAIDATWEAEY